MQFLNSWLQGIIISVVISTIIEMILPNGNTKKYVKVVLGIYVMFNIITPIINEFTNSNFEVASIINIEEYTKKMETSEINLSNLDKTSQKNIKEIYINSLESDISAKLEEKDYFIKDIQVDIEDDETYKIRNINLSLVKKEEQEINKENIEENKVSINEIEIAEIQIGNIDKNNQNDNKEESSIKESEKREIKKYLSSVYEIKESQIIIN